MLEMMLAQASKVLFNSKETLAKSCEKVENDFEVHREIKAIIDFIRNSDRGIYQGTI